jgi:uncharacterized protein RhaS with RHS repeats
MGRWLTRDPLQEAGGINLYGFVKNNPVNFIDPYGLDWLDTAANYSAGFGDTISFGLTDWVRDQLGSNSAVNKCSGAYSAGEISGYAWEVGMGGAGIARAAGFKTLFHHYPNARGAGMMIVKRGKKIFGAEWHRFKIKSGQRGVPGKLVNRPHIDIPPKGVNHWPW